MAEVTSAATVAATVSLPWVEKYRPASVDAVSSQSEVVAALQEAISTGNMPHLLFYGPPGTGKTLLAKAVGAEISKNLRNTSWKITLS